MTSTSVKMLISLVKIELVNLKFSNLDSCELFEMKLANEQFEINKLENLEIEVFEIHN